MPPAPRPYWNGHVRLSLVTFPVHIYTATTNAEKIRLHKIEKKTGKRIHYQNITEGDHVVEPEDIVKGYEYEKDHYVPIEDKELKKLRVESTHMVDIVQFTDFQEIDSIYFDRPYYMVPDGRIAEEAFVTLRESLRAAKKVALGQITLAGKERIAAIKPCGKGMMLETLRYDYEVRKASEIFKDIPESMKLSKEQVELAEQLIERKSAPFDPRAFKDSYQEGLLEIIEAKLENREIKTPVRQKEPPRSGDILEALKRSLEQADKSAGRKKKPTRKKPAARRKRKAS